MDENYVPKPSVREEQEGGSDIDILVEFKEGYKTFDNYMDLKFYLEELLDLRVDLVSKTALKPRLRPYILKEVVYV
ncbi:MAG: nucleotidyltransferase domain-containing protein [Armatimonadota bacterium]